MSSSKGKAVLALIALMAIGDMILIEAGEIMCHVCNSDDHKGCTELAPSSSMPQKKCSDAGYEDYGLQPMCTKSVTKEYLTKTGPPKITVHRQCLLGNWGQKGKCVEDKVGHSVETIECECNGAICNGATPSKSNIPQILIALCVVASCLKARLRN